MATSLALSLDTRRARHDSTYPIIIRLTHNTKTTGIKSGYWIKESDWDKKKRRIKVSAKNTESPTRLNNLLAKKKTIFTDILTKLEDKGELKFMTLKQVKERLAPSTGHQATVFSYADELIRDLVKSNRSGTARGYHCMLGVLKGFTKNRDLVFSALNADLLKRFEIWHLAKEGNGLNSLAVYMRALRALYNKAIRDGVAEREAYPFNAYTIRTSKTSKRAITLEAIKKILDLNLDNELKLYYTRQIFLMSFYLQGMPFIDMAHLKLSNIIDGRIKYSRQKTKRPYDVKITPQLHALLKKFTAGKEKDDYLLPVIKRTEPAQQYKDIQWAMARYNKNLKALATKAGIEENLTSYVARHSFATIADEMEIPITGIRDMLGHERVSTTEAYLNDLRKSKMDEYQGRVFKDIESESV